MSDRYIKPITSNMDLVFPENIAERNAVRIKAQIPVSSFPNFKLDEGKYFQRVKTKTAINGIKTISGICILEPIHGGSRTSVNPTETT